MDHEAGRLVDNAQMLVLVQHGNRHALGPEGLALRRGPQLDAPGGARMHRGRSLVEHAPLDRHHPRLDQLLQVAARKLGHQRRKRAVEPLPMLILAEQKVANFARLGQIRALVVLDRACRFVQGVGRYN